MQYQLDFSNVEDFDLIPEGKYNAVVEEVTMEENKAGDGHNLVWLWSVDVDGVHRKLRMWTSLKPNALWRLKAILKTLNLYQDAINIEVDEDTNFVIEPDLVGVPAVVQITTSKVNGSDRSSIADVFPADAETGAAVPAGSNGAKKSKARLV